MNLNRLLSRQLRRINILLSSATLATSVLAPALLQAALPDPLVDLTFSEGADTTTANAGALAGVAVFAQANDYPIFSVNVPAGPFSPPNNTGSVEFGPILAAQGGRAIDLVAEGDGTLGSLGAFTVCGWLNCRDLNEGFGGNRIAFALQSPDGAGFDLVQLANGALRIGVNQWPDGANGGGPQSSAGKITVDANQGPANWVFFAVTYDGSIEAGNLSYYFGTPQALASSDSVHNYNRGILPATGALTVGNFSGVVGARNELGPNGPSRVFRGLVDELKVYDVALNLSEVQSIQLNGTPPPLPVTFSLQPANLSVFEGLPARFVVNVTGTAPFSYQWTRDGADIPEATSQEYTLSAVSLADHGAVFRVKVSNPVSTAALSGPATLSVVVDDGHKISLSFSDGGATVTNLGNLAGRGSYVVRENYPATSANVPSGSLAPGNNIASVDFGGIDAGQGGRAIDLANGFDNTLGSLTSFTITGWLNARDLREGFGGNRIAFALAQPNGPGFDLVQLASGALRIGVNQWPDGANGGGPSSSAGKILADPETGAGNWVFFAVTYDGLAELGNIAYYFGNADQAAELDVIINYPRGPIETTGSLTIGNFSSVVTARNETGPTGGSRCFRGLIDEINILNKVLSLEEIQVLQNKPAYQPQAVGPVVILEAPRGQTVFEGATATFSISVSGSLPLNYQWHRRHGGVDSVIPDATAASYTLVSPATTDTGDEFWVVVRNAVNTVTSERATLSVAVENHHKIALAFSESGTTVPNLGNLAGEGTYALRDGFPVGSANVPIGAFAPENNDAAVDFGTIAAGEGGRAIDFVNDFDDTLGSMTAFTITGWLNARDLSEGFGGNRIAFALESPNGPGFDLVQVASGGLRIGVNQWPDGANGGGPSSSAGKITADPEAGPGNWVFFAVVYDSSLEFGNLSYYFGTADQAAELDVSTDYQRGPIEKTGALTVGNFSGVVGARNETGPGGGSRCFRGLIDELNIFNTSLSHEEILVRQKASAVAPAPVLTASKEGNQIVLSWETSPGLKLQYRADLRPGEWFDEPTIPVVVGPRSTVRLATTGLTRFYRLLGP